jgi:predicted nucleic acid-binding protein
MSRLVVDSCVAIKWLVNEPGSGAAGRLLHRYLDERTELLAPDSIESEIGNSLWKRFHRGLMTADEAQQAFARFRALQITTIACGRLLDDAMRLAIEHRRSFYDCLFLALSLQENCPFVTADEKLANAVGRVFANLELLATDP